MPDQAAVDPDQLRWWLDLRGGAANCSACDGTGQAACVNCRGEGEVECRCCEEMRSCPECDGHGEGTCDECDGQGLVLAPAQPRHIPDEYSLQFSCGDGGVSPLKLRVLQRGRWRVRLGGSHA